MLDWRRAPRLLGLSAVALAVALTGCGQSGSSTGTATPTGGTTTAPGGAAAPPGGGGCRAATGQELMVLADDKKLQTVDNIIPAINAAAATPALVQALDKISAALTTEKLVALNRAVEVERKTSPNVAQEFTQQENLVSGLSGGSGEIVVGAANFAENATLANIYEDVLDAAGFAASVRTIGNRELYLPALQQGEIDVVPEYVGTLTEFLNKKQNGANAAPKASGELEPTVAALTQLGSAAKLRFGQPSQAADQNAFAVTKAFADANGLKTLSDLAAKCNGGELVLGGPPECPDRPFCRPGLERTYGLKFTGFSALDAGGPLTQAALRQGKVTLGLVFSSAGFLSSG
jgi:osmoprotectant transport system substrate-binding protein